MHEIDRALMENSRIFWRYRLYF